VVKKRASGEPGRDSGKKQQWAKLGGVKKGGEGKTGKGVWRLNRDIGD